MSKGKRAAAKGGAVPTSAKTKKNNRNKSRKPWIISGCILLVCVILGVVLYDMFISPPPLPDDLEQPESTPYYTTDPGGNQVLVTPKPAASLTYNKDIRTILGTAVFDGSNTDTLMVAVLDYKSNTLKVLSIPRDTTLYYNSRRTKINAVYATTKDKDEKMNALLNAVGRLTGFTPGGSVYVKAAAFTKMVDAVGGIDFDVPVSMSKPGENIDLAKGQQTLDGQHALMLLRYRGYSGLKGIPDVDYGRMYMQQQFLSAAAKQILKPKNITKVPEFVSIFNENVSTSLAVDDMTWYAKEIMECVGADSIEFYTLPTQSKYTKGWYDYIVLDEALLMLNEHFNPYTTPITEDILNLDYYFPTRNAELVSNR